MNGYVFPTPVGVFLHGVANGDTVTCLPHARGGVSNDECIRYAKNRSSPRPWGCFYMSYTAEHPQEVFPTPVGVFLTGVGTTHVDSGLPHARGGVSQL